MSASDDSGPAWDRIWIETGAARRDPVPPSPEVERLAGVLAAAGLRRVLDLGCGAGRHAICLAARGFEVHAVDVSPAAVAACRAAVATAGYAATVQESGMDSLPYPDAFFDWVLSVNVIYHGRRAEVRRALAEVRRVLRPGGWLLATMLSIEDEKREWYLRELAADRAEEPEPRVYRALEPGPTDEHVPHLFVDEDELRPGGGLLDAWEVREVRRAADSSSGLWNETRRKAHWVVVARVPPA